MKILRFTLTSLSLGFILCAGLSSTVGAVCPNPGKYAGCVSACAAGGKACNATKGSDITACKNGTLACLAQCKTDNPGCPK